MIVNSNHDENHNKIYQTIGRVRQFVKNGVVEFIDSFSNTELKRKSFL